MLTHGTRETGTIHHEGRDYAAGGAYRSEDGQRIGVYLRDTDRTVTTWSGERIGQFVVTGTWWQCPPRSRYPEPFRMRSVRIYLDDGTVYNGRYGCDWGTFCRARIAK